MSFRRRSSESTRSSRPTRLEPVGESSVILMAPPPCLSLLKRLRVVEVHGGVQQNEQSRQGHSTRRYS